MSGRGKIGGRVIGAFAATGITRALHVVLAIVLARALGQDGYGAYVFASGVGLLGARLAGLGWPPLMLRLIPEMVCAKAWGDLRGLMRAGLWVVGSAGALLGVGLAVLVWQAEHRLALWTLFGAALIPLWALRALGRAQLHGLGHSARGIVLDGGLVAGLVLLGLGAVWVMGRGVTVPGALIGTLIASGVVAGLALWWPLQRCPAIARAQPPVYATRAWMALAVPLLLGAVARLMMERSDVLLLAPLSTLEAVGTYGVATRLCVLQTLIATTLNVVLTPEISAARARGQSARAARLLGLGVALTGASAAALALVFWVWGGALIGGIFGPDFAQAGPVLAVLGGAQIFGALSIPLSGFVIVAGRQNAFAWLSIGALICSGAVSLALIPSYGALGAAWGTLAGLGALCLGLGAVCVGSFDESSPSGSALAGRSSPGVSAKTCEITPRRV